MQYIFREYDIRGVFPQELNEQIVKKIGFYFAKEVKKNFISAKYITVAYDSRTHSKILKRWLVSGIKKANLEVIDIGLVPTPVLFYSDFISFDDFSSYASIMITGSHNPSQYNGFKLTLNKEPFFGEDIYALGRKILADNHIIEDNEKVIKINFKDKYVDYLVKEFSHLKLENKRFVFDCGNGVAGVVLREVLDRLNIKHKILFEKPDGTFPNHHPDPNEEENLSDLKKSLVDSNFAFAYDGDADRVAFLSKKYNFKADILAIFFSKFIKNPTVIADVKCSALLFDTINSYGKAVMGKTGHSNLKAKMKELNASLGVELTGHLYFNDRHFGFTDGIYSTLRILELIDEGFDFDKEYERLPKVFSSPEIYINVREENKFRLIEDLKKALECPPSYLPKIKDIITIDGIRIVFEEGWALVRASNTTPKLVTRFEGSDEKIVQKYKESVMKLYESILTI